VNGFKFDLTQIRGRKIGWVGHYVLAYFTGPGPRYAVPARTTINLFHIFVQPPFSSLSLILNGLYGERWRE
jgi:hypothetical protein